MKIKKITLHNFKCYVQRQEFYPPQHGVVQLVGNNGSGKSAVLEAVNFVLKSINGLNNRERIKYISYNKKSCFVEVTFAPVDFLENEITIGRYLTPTKDCFYINRVNVKKHTFAYVLEMLGFPQREPLIHLDDDFISKVVACTTQVRMNLLLNLLGDRFVRARDSIVEAITSMRGYEARAKLCEARLESIQKKLSMNRSGVQSRLKETIRTIEIILHERVFNECESQLQKIASSKTYFANCMDPTDIDLSLDLKQDELKLAETRRKVVDFRLKQLTEQRPKSGGGDEKPESRCDQGLQLFQLEKQLKIKKKQAEETRNTLRVKELELQRATSGYMAVPEEKKILLRDNLKECDAEIRVLNSEIEELEKERKLKSDSALRTKKEIKRQALKKQYETVLGELRDCYKLEQEMKENLAKITKKSAENKKSLSLKLGNNIVNGLESVRLILQNWRNSDNPIETEQGGTCYGFVADNIEYPANKIIQHCIGVVAGRRLFHLIAQDQQAVARMVSEMTRLNLPGKINFILANSIKVPEQRILQPTEDYRLLRNEITCSTRVNNVADAIFGNVVLCRNAEVAAIVRKNHNMACITTEGFMFKNDGTIGVRREKERRKPVLHFYSEWSSLLREETDTKDQLSDVRSRIELVQSKMSKISKEIESIETELQKHDPSFTNLEVVEKVLKKKKELSNAVNRKKLAELQLEQAERTPASWRISSPTSVVTLKQELYQLKTTCLELDSEIKCLEEKWKARKLFNINAEKQEEKPSSTMTGELNNLLAARERLQIVVAEGEKTRVDDATSSSQAKEKKRKNYSDCQNIGDLTKEIQKRRALIDDIRRQGPTSSFTAARYKNFGNAELEDILKAKKTLLAEEEEIQNNFFGKFGKLEKFLRTFSNFNKHLGEFKSFVSHFSTWLEQTVVQCTMNVEQKFSRYIDIFCPGCTVDIFVMTNTDEPFPVSALLLGGTMTGMIGEATEPFHLLPSPEKLFIASAFLLASRRAQNFNICFLDEVDKVLSGQQCADFWKALMKIDNMQIFLVSHSGSLVCPQGPYVSISAAPGGCKLNLIEREDDDW